MSLQSAQMETDWLQEAKECLEAWGAEERRQRRALGYHGETLEYVSMRYGGAFPKGGGQRKEEERPDVVETDAIVSAMAQIRGGEQIRAALYIYYVYQKSIGRGAHVLRCSKSFFQSLLERGQDRVAMGLLTRASS